MKILLFLYKHLAQNIEAFIKSSIPSPLKNLILMGILLSIIPISAFAAPIYYDQSTSGASSISIDSPSKPKSEGNTGALNYQYKFKIPEGRNGMTPDISINYNSQNNENQNWVGYSFGLNIPYIKQNNLNGISSIYTDNNFTSNNYGDLMLSTSSSVYVAKKGDLTRAEFTKLGDTWTVIDNTGSRYVYGGDINSRMQNATNTFQIYQWYLTDIIDVFGNNIHYNYIKDGEYVYPYNITYTNNNLTSLNGIYEIRFNLETRNDITESYQSGFKILNGKRVSSVELFVSGIKKKNFGIRYKNGANGVRSLLAGITEAGYDDLSIAKSLPETVFNYSQPLTESKTLNIPNVEFDRITDINGDGLVDFVKSRTSFYGDYYNNFNVNKKIYLNKGDLNFEEINILNKNTACDGVTNYGPGDCRAMPATEIPFNLSNSYNYNSSGPYPDARFLLDSNDDGYIDVLNTYGNLKGLPFKDVSKVSTTITVGTTTQIVSTTTIERQYATSSLFWETDNALSVPNSATGIQSLNLNGDRKPDLEYQPWQSNNTQAMISNAIIYLDLNGDGLDDKAEVYSYWYQAQPRTEYKNIWINNGANFVLQDATSSAKYSLPRSYERTTWFDSQSSNIYADINFDGLVDAYTFDGSSSINTGIGIDGSYYYGNGYIPSGSGGFAVDLNGDGLPEIAKANSTAYTVTVSKMKADLLTSIKNNLGGEDTFVYAPAVSYKKQDGTQANKVSYPIWTLKSQTSISGVGTSTTKNYSYEDAYVSRLGNYDNTLAGFGKVITVEPNNLKNISYYHQGNENNSEETNDSVGKIGKLYKQEIFNSLNNLEKKDLVEYSEFSNPISAYSSVSLPIKSINFIYDQNSSSTFVTANSAEYDVNLNKTKQTNFGDVAFTGSTTTLSFIDTNANDTKLIETTFNNSITQVKKFLPLSKTAKDSFNNLLGKEDYYYDNNLNTNISNGLLTQKDIHTSSTTKQTERTIYDTQYGLPTQDIDPRGATTTLSYDIYKLFPSQSTNALNQTNILEYNYTFGKIKKSIDANSLETKLDYDGFGRTTKTYKNSILLEERIYGDTYLPDLNVKKYSNATDTQSKVSYFDGFARIIKEKTENVNGGYSTKDTYYDFAGNVIKESLPYNSTTLGRIDNATLPEYNFKNYIRDSFGRIVESKTVLGSDKIVYGARNKKVIDKNNHETLFEYDKDNLITKAQENNLGQVYNTNYKYDTKGNLTNILDSENQIRNINYDLVGRKIGDEIAHKNATATIATTTFAYGPLNEFLEILNSDGVKLKTSFDILGRKINEISTKQLTATTTSSITNNQFTYDICANGLGKICTASSSDGVLKKYSYNTNGDLIKLETIANNTLWSPSSTNYFNYDLQSNIMSQGDGLATTTNTFAKNTIQNISYVDINSTSTSIFSNPTYDYSGQIISFDRGAIKQINTYDDKNLNRLSNFLLLKYGSESYPSFATSTLVALPLNNATSTAIVLREKGLPGSAVIRANKTSASYVYSDNSPNAYSSVGIIKNLSSLATATPITQLQARTSFEAIFGVIPVNGMNLNSYLLYPSSSAQQFIIAVTNSYWYVSQSVPGALNYVFGTPNPRDASIPLPVNLTVNTADNILNLSTSKNQGLAISTFVGAYYNLFVKEKYLQLNDSNSYIQLFKRNSASGDLSVWPDSGQTYNECDVSRPYSNPISLSAIATGTYLQIPVNTNYKNDYFTASSTSQFISTCLMEGHSINNPSITLSTSTPQIRNELVFSHNYSELYSLYTNDQIYKILGGLTVNYNATNTKSNIVSNTYSNIGQGLQTKLDIGTNDIEKDVIQNVEIYFNKATTSTSTSQYNLLTINNIATNTATATLSLSNFPFEYGKNYSFISRIKDIYGDWSNYSTSTYNTLSSASSTGAICKTRPNTILGSINCPDPDFRIMFKLEDTNYVDSGYIPSQLKIWSATITVATSSNIASSTLGSVSRDNLLEENFNTLINIKNNRGILLKQNSRYYYNVSVVYAWDWGAGSSPRYYISPNNYTSPVVQSFTTGDFKTLQNSSYSYDTLSRIKSVLKDEDSKYENTIYTYDELSRLTQVEKKTNSVSTSTNITESYTYSPTGKMFSNGGNGYIYGSDLAHTPTQIGLDILSWDTRGRLSTSTTLGALTWNNLDRVSQIQKGATTSKYYYDTDGNRVLSFILNTVGTTTKTVSRLFTPNANTQTNGTTTSYAINLGSKPIINIDRKIIPAGSTSTISVVKLIGTNNATSSEFTSASTNPTLNTSITTNLANVRPFIGRKGSSTFSQTFSFTNLVINTPQSILLTFSTTTITKPFSVTIVSGSATTTPTFTPSPTSHIINFTPNTTSLTLKLSTTATTTNTLTLDSYTLTLNQISTSTTATTTTQIQTLITDHLNSIEKVLDYNSGDVISTSTYTSFGTQVKEGNTNSNRGYTNQQSDQDSTGLNYYNARYQNPSYAQFISPDEATKAIGDDAELSNITKQNTQEFIHNPQSLNSYSYVNNNPIHYTDPSGDFLQVVAGVVARTAATFYGAGVIGAYTSDVVNNSFDGASTYSQLLSPQSNALSRYNESGRDAVLVNGGAALVTGGIGSVLSRVKQISKIQMYTEAFSVGAITYGINSKNGDEPINAFGKASIVSVASLGTSFLTGKAVKIPGALPRPSINPTSAYLTGAHAQYEYAKNALNTFVETGLGAAGSIVNIVKNKAYER